MEFISIKKSANEKDLESVKHHCHKIKSLIDELYMEYIREDNHNKDYTYGLILALHEKIKSMV